MKAKGKKYPVLKELFKSPAIAYSPAEIRKIRHMLGESIEEFRARFYVSEATAKGWETPEGKAKHSPLGGPALRLMFWAAVEANEKGSSINNLIWVAYKKVNLEE